MFLEQTSSWYIKKRDVCHYVSLSFHYANTSDMLDNQDKLDSPSHKTNDSVYNTLDTPFPHSNNNNTNDTLVLVVYILGILLIHIQYDDTTNNTTISYSLHHHSNV